MKAKEAKARIKINKLLEESGWRFFDTDEGPANIYLEPNVKITQKILILSARILKKQKMVLLIICCWMIKAIH